ISVKSVDTRKECDLSTIKSVGIQYTPATELTSDAKKISMQVIDIYDYEDETQGDETEGDDNTGNDNQGGGDSGGGGGFSG
ncbi:MAG: hypothetical protein IKY79_08260, partial [Bacteroidales bacterium]|nr:hypothetical protein [Bacteroidales bacterium]